MQSWATDRLPVELAEKLAQQDASLRLFVLRSRRESLIEDLKLLGVLPADFVPSPTFLLELQAAELLGSCSETLIPGHPAGPEHGTDGHELRPQAGQGAAESDHKESCGDAGTAGDAAQASTEGAEKPAMAA